MGRRGNRTHGADRIGTKAWHAKQAEIAARKPITTFAEFQALNRHRCEEKFHALHEWLPGGWPLAICGEAGELANMVKKVIRGDFTIMDARPAMLKELADIICYSDLMISALGADTAQVLMNKFDEVSDRVGYERC